MTNYKTYEYIWLDGYKPESSMRSKVKATDAETPPDWSFDGSSTQQAEGGSSDCLLLPVQTYSNPNGHDLVMTQVPILQIIQHTHLILEQQLKL
jgi:glutamine synthetase